MIASGTRCRPLNALPMLRNQRPRTPCANQLKLIDSVLREVLADSGHSHEASWTAASVRYQMKVSFKPHAASPKEKTFAADLRSERQIEEQNLAGDTREEIG